MSVSVNGVPVSTEGWPTEQMAAVFELLRQHAMAQELVAHDADDDTVAKALETLLEQEVEVPEPDVEECRRYYELHKDRYRSGELVHARHILFQIAPGVPVANVLSVAEAMHAELMQNPEVFAERARKNSNCPSSEQGGNLGQLQRGQTVPEFEKAVFGSKETGVLSELVKTRHGFHIVCVDERIRGEQLPFEAVADAVAKQMRAGAEQHAISQYVRVLAGQADIEGIELEAVGSPLVQ